jgi:hypothetical protein
MDPDAALRNLRSARDRFDEFDDPFDAHDPAVDMADHFSGLDDWMSKGGFPPAEWADARSRLEAEDRVRSDTRWVDETGGLL